MVVVSILAASEEDRRVLGDLLGRPPVTEFALLAKRADWIRSGGTVEPDYRSLVELLPNLGRVPDALGDTELSEEEAARIQSLGFTAKPGPWNVPPLPDELVRDNGLLQMFSETWRAQNEGRDPPEYPINPRHSGILGVHESCLEIRVGEPPPDAGQKEYVRPWSRDEEEVYGALERGGGHRRRRPLQQRLWRMGAERFSAAIQSLIRREVVQDDGRFLLITRGRARDQSGDSVAKEHVQSLHKPLQPR